MVSFITPLFQKRSFGNTKQYNIQVQGINGYNRMSQNSNRKQSCFCINHIRVCLLQFFFYNFLFFFRQTLIMLNHMPVLSPTLTCKHRLNALKTFFSFLFVKKFFMVISTVL